jgi:hypothetical protein
MKKIFCILFFLIIFSACGDDRELDFRSMRDTELGVVISLGDNRERLVRLMGEPVHEIPSLSIRGGTLLIFANEMDVTVYNDEVKLIFAENNLDSGRFEIYGYRVGMTPSQIAANLDENEEHSGIASRVTDGTVHIYMNFYDASGNKTTGNASVAGGVEWWDTSAISNVLLSVHSLDIGG